MNLTYGAAYFVRWLFDQDEAWLTSKGEWKVIQSGYENTMATQHLINTLLMLERTVYDIYFAAFGEDVADDTTSEEMSEWLITTPLYEAMKRELFARL